MLIINWNRKRDAIRPRQREAKIDGGGIRSKYAFWFLRAIFICNDLHNYRRLSCAYLVAYSLVVFFVIENMWFAIPSKKKSSEQRLIQIQGYQIKSRGVQGLFVAGEVFLYHEISFEFLAREASLWFDFFLPFLLSYFAALEVGVRWLLGRR